MSESKKSKLIDKIVISSDDSKISKLYKDTNIDFIEKIGLNSHLSQTRANGLLSMIKQIKIYALAYQVKK